jgi:glycosyltransferase involved in cell wall biosynthesis
LCFDQNQLQGKKRIVWISFLILDILFHKTSRIEMLKHLSKRGYDANLFGVISQKKLELKNSNVQLQWVPLKYVPGLSPLLFAFFLFLFLPFYVITCNFKVVVTEPGVSILGFIWIPFFSRFRRFQIVLDIRSTPVEVRGASGLLETVFFRFSVVFAKRFFDGITIITNSMKKEICEEFSIDSSRVGVWTSGVSLELFNPEKKSSGGAEIRKKFGLDGKFVVFYHGNFGIMRGLVDCVNSIEKLSDFPNIVLFLLGNGKALPEIQEAIEKGNLKDRVIIHNPVNYLDVPKYIAMCDVAIVPLPALPDWRNQCPLKLLEYLSMGKCVILTDIPAHREVVGSSKCGIYLASSDQNYVAEGIKYAYNNRDLLKEFGSSGREIVRKKYSWDKIAADFDAYLENIKSG